MKARYFLLTSTLLLAACGADTAVQVASGQGSFAASDTAAVSALDEQQAEASRYEAVGGLLVETGDNGTENRAASDQIAEATVAAAVSQPSASLLPVGRLIGIVDSEHYRQATIDNQGKVLRLREGDDWQGWTVKSIGRKKIVISQDNTEHTLLLLTEFRALEPVQRQSRDLSVPENYLVDQEGNAVSPPFTQQQLIELRSHLLMGRSEH